MVLFGNPNNVNVELQFGIYCPLKSEGKCNNKICNDDVAKCSQMSGFAWRKEKF